MSASRGRGPLTGVEEAGDAPGGGDRSAADLRDLSRLLGLTVVAATTPAHGLSNRTDVVTTAEGRRLVVQRLPGAWTAPRRVALARALPGPLAAVGVPVPAVLLADARSRPPFVAYEFAAGRPGIVALQDPADAVALGTEMGRLSARVRLAPTGGLRLPSTWADPTRLTPVASRWLSRAARSLDAGAAGELAASIGRLPRLLGGRPAVLAHGDWAPVNVLVADGGVVAVVDWEAARLADPLFDLAWWGAIVRAFHPNAWVRSWPALLEAAGVEPDRATTERLRALGTLRMLEVLASARVADDPAAAAAWARRLTDGLSAND